MDIGIERVAPFRHETGRHETGRHETGRQGTGRDDEGELSLLAHMGRGAVVGLVMGCAAIAAYAAQYYRPEDALAAEARSLYTFYPGYTEIPWNELFVQVPTAGLVTGAWMNLAFGLAFVFVRRVGWPSATLLPLAPLLGGLFGTAPAVIAGTHFGSMSAPYVGPIILVPVLSAGGILLAASAARSAGHGWLASIAATVVPLVVAAPVLGVGAYGLEFSFVLPLVDSVGVVPVAVAGGGLIGAIFGFWVASSLVLVHAARAPSTRRARLRAELARDLRRIARATG
jgi:hypothetical protein